MFVHVRSAANDAEVRITMSEGQFNALAEGSEAEFMYQYESMAPQATKASLGIATARIGSGVVLSMRHDVTGYWSEGAGVRFR